MKFDPAKKHLWGNYCERCGRQEFDRQATTCKICGGPLFKWRPPRRKPDDRALTLDELIERSDVPAAHRQKQVLERHGYPTSLSKAEASRIIGALARNNWQPLPVPPTAP